MFAGHEQQPMMSGSPYSGGGPGGQYPQGQQGYNNYPPGNQYGQQQGAYEQNTGFPPRGQGGMNMLGNLQTSTYMNLVFFAAACCIMVGAFLGGIALFFNGSLVDFLNLTYILIFGAIFAVLDTPFFKMFKICQDMKVWIGKYVNILTRVTGKGVCFIFLGCALNSAMFSNLNNGFMDFIAVVLNLFVIIVGIAAVAIGIVKSQKLRRAQRELMNGVLANRYGEFAVQFPEKDWGAQSGLTPQEFNNLTTENARLTWDETDLQLIFNALVRHPAWRKMPSQNEQGRPYDRSPDEARKILQTDLQAWVNSNTTVYL
mmetsp:Transcript_54292/g.151101  ORF Transcript_54292/g.151101 Transcript_54292/m.151101 type:complete len:315 (-) Transcript_54292:124-1068(-)